MQISPAPFNRTEQQVIALAASSRRECAFVDEPPARLWTRLLNLLAPGRTVQPLANERLEALRRLACASFATGGHPSAERLAAARTAGLTEDEIETLKRIAASYR